MVPKSGAPFDAVSKHYDQIPKIFESPLSFHFIEILICYISFIVIFRLTVFGLVVNDRDFDQILYSYKTTPA